MGPPEYQESLDVLASFLGNDNAVLALLGPRGSGKTQAACVAVQNVLRTGAAARFVTLRRLLANLRDRYGSGGCEEEWYEEWAEPYLLVIDEITEKGDSLHDAQALTELVNERYQRRHLTILVGNVERTGYADLVGPSISSRTNESGGILWFGGWPSFRNHQKDTPP